MNTLIPTIFIFNQKQENIQETVIQLAIIAQTVISLVIVIAIALVILFLGKLIVNYFGQAQSHINESQHVHSWVTQEVNNKVVVFCAHWSPLHLKRLEKFILFNLKKSPILRKNQHDVDFRNI